MKRRTSWMAALALTCLSTVAAAQELKLPQTTPPAMDQAALEKQFAETMSGAVMVGSFTTTGQGKDRLLKEEKYTLDKVSKMQGDYWLFEVRIQYGDKDAKLPLPLQVKWSGDTPVITLTKQPIPGFGTFTSRVLIYDNHYAGFWWGGDHGGHLFGKIEKAKPAEDEKPSEKSGEAKPK